jgi:hypothetical protein
MFMSKLLSVILIFLACGQYAHATVTVEIAGTPPLLNAKDQQTILYIIAKGGSISNFKCWVNALVPEHGDPAPPGSINCSAPGQIDAGKIEQMTLSMSADKRLKRGNYTATLQILGLDSTNASVSQATSFKVLVPAVSIKLADTDILRIRITRRIPFLPASGIVPVAFRITSDGDPTIVPSVLQSELYVPNGALKDVVPGGSLRGEFCTTGTHEGEPWYTSFKFWRLVTYPEGCEDGGHLVSPGSASGLAGLNLQVEPLVPSNIKEATGTLHLQSTEFQSDYDIPVTILVKDWWGYAALVVFLGQLLSFYVNNWINVGRRRKLNKLALSPVESGLVNLLLGRPDLIGSPDVAIINSLLDNAAQSNRLGDVDAAMSSIKAAQDKLTALAALPAPQPSEQVSPPALFLLQKGHAYAFRRLNFAILNPDKSWSSKAVYKWEWKGQKTEWATLFEAQNLKDIVTEFYAPGLYNIRLSIDGIEVATYDVRLDKDNSTGILWQVAQADKAILLLAVLFATILSYLAIDQLQTFGTVSDYALAFLGGFGLSSTTSGFSAVLSRFGTSLQGGAPAKS